MSNGPRHTLRRSAGLTAVELLAGLAIVALLLAVAAPSFRHYAQQQRLRAAVTAMHSSLALARSEAIQRGARVIVCPASGSGGCGDANQWLRGWLVFQDLDDDRERSDNEPLLQQAPAFEGLSIRGSRHRARLRFFPNGTAPGSNATLVFCDSRGPERARQVVVSASGRIRSSALEEPTGGRCGP